MARSVVPGAPQSTCCFHRQRQAALLKVSTDTARRAVACRGRNSTVARGDVVNSATRFEPSQAAHRRTTLLQVVGRLVRAVMHRRIIWIIADLRRRRSRSRRRNPGSRRPTQRVAAACRNCSCGKSSTSGERGRPDNSRGRGGKASASHRYLVDRTAGRQLAQRRGARRCIRPGMHSGLRTPCVPQDRSTGRGRQPRPPQRRRDTAAARAPAAPRTPVPTR